MVIYYEQCVSSVVIIIVDDVVITGAFICTQYNDKHHIEQCKWITCTREHNFNACTW